MPAHGAHVALATLAVAITWSQCVNPAGAHAPGEEFTYLNMFRKAQSTKGHYDTDSFVNAGHASGGEAGSAPHRRLHSSSRKKPAAGLNAPGEPEGDVAPEEDATIGGRRRRLRSSTSESSAAATDDAGGEAASALTGRGSEGDDGKDAPRHEPEQEFNSEAGPPAHKDAPAAKQHETMFEGVGGNSDGEDIKRVSYMLMKILKQYKAQSMVDVPCRAHASWMHKFLVHVEQEIPDFKYFCVDSNQELLQAVKLRVKGKANAKFIARQFWLEKLPRADLVFSWSGLEKMKEENVLKFFRNVGTSDRHKYVILGNHMKGSKLLKKKATAMNVRKSPFLLTQPMRVVSKLSVDPVRKQMYVYKADEMRVNWEA
jgi:hypothetical protein